MKIGGLQKSSLIDYPSKIAAIIFTQGCNFRCGYCHNPELLGSEGKTSYSEESVLEFLKSRTGLLDGVVITGGEPTLQKDLVDFVHQVKSLGFAVKIDTNGTSPEVIETLLSQNLVDYIAMDIKAPLEKYETITQTKTDPQKIQNSIKIIMNSGVEYEFRTTVLKSQLCLEDFDEIGKLICGSEKYFLQKFVSSKIFDESLNGAETYSDEEFASIKLILNQYMTKIIAR